MNPEARFQPDKAAGIERAVTNPQRRMLLGGAARGSLAAAAATGALALLRPDSAAASGNPDWYNVVTDFQAVGDGIADDTPKLQNAINAAGSAPAGSIRPVYVPPGIYKITSALTIPSYVKIFGAGRTYSSIIRPHNCGLFVIDGGSGWVQGIFLSDLVADLNTASAAVAVYINKAYNIGIRDVFFNESGPNVACSVLIQDCNDVVLDNTSICGRAATTASNPLGLSITGSSDCTVKLIATDCEYFNVAMKTSGHVVVDMVSPYAESSMTNYLHAISAGQVNIYGGTMQGATGAAHVIDIQGDNLAIYGTHIFLGSYTTSALKLAATPTFKNVRVYGAFNVASPSVLPSGSNHASIEFFPPLTPLVSRATVDVAKILTSGTPANLLSLSTSDVMKCRLTIYAYVGAGSACATAQYDFVLGSNGAIPTIATSAASSTANGIWSVAVSNPTLTTAGSGYVFSITATSTGAGGAPISLFGQLDYVSYDAGVTNKITKL